MDDQAGRVTSTGADGRYYAPPPEALSDKELRALYADAADCKGGGCRYVLIREQGGRLVTERLGKAP